jgi:hypothetical protein
MASAEWAGSRDQSHALLQRRAVNESKPATVPMIVNDVLRSPGQALDPATRASMESRFSYDFSRVRVHTDSEAAQSARAINALAYTVGSKVVFGSNQYAPQTPAGRRLLKHELTHVTQNRNAAADSSLEIGSASSAEERVAEHNETSERPTKAGAAVSRVHLKPAGGSPGGFLANIGRGIADFFTGSEPDYEKKTLQEYLQYLKDQKDIQDDFDSDNKARAVVHLWMKGDAEFELMAGTKILLIKEMQSGTTGDDDENAILDLLENSVNHDLRTVFGGGGVDVKELNDDFHGAEWKRLQAFYTDRFDGGMAALLAGKVEPVGGAKAGAPKFPYNWPVLKAKLDGPYTVAEIVAEIGAFSEAEQNQALKDVGEERVVQQRLLTELRDKFNAETDPAAKKLLETQFKTQKDLVLRLDFIVQPVFKDIALAETPATLSGKTKVLTAAEKTEAKTALKPELKTDSKGVVLPFTDKLVGETKTYVEKVRDFMPDMIKRYYDRTVVGRGATEHGDVSKTHKLEEMEALGNVSKNETDAVFGAYYDKGKHPPLKADTPKKGRTPAKRGNIHDLWQDTADNLNKLNFDQRQEMAKVLIFYFFQSNGGVAAINRAHNADPQFTPGDKPKPINAEAKALDTLAKEFTKTAKQVKDLNEIDRGWDASAGQGEISIQLFKPAVTADDPAGTTPEDKDRDFLWDMFQTLIHEYLHTLVHDKYEKYAESFGGTQSNQYNTLIAWANVEPRVNDPGLREKVEGPTYAKLPAIKVKHASRRRYASYAQAIKLVNIVGIRNLYAAYFMGETDKIGK